MTAEQVSTTPSEQVDTVYTYYFSELLPPATGQPLIFKPPEDLGIPSTVKLYQDTAKTILISTVTEVDPMGRFIFPSSDVAAMTDFSTPTVELILPKPKRWRKL